MREQYNKDRRTDFILIHSDSRIGFKNDVVAPKDFGIGKGVSPILRRADHPKELSFRHGFSQRISIDRSILLKPM